MLEDFEKIKQQTKINQKPPNKQVQIKQHRPMVQTYNFHASLVPRCRRLTCAAVRDGSDWVLEVPFILKLMVASPK